MPSAVVTVTNHPRRDDLLRAEAIARRCGLAFVSRKKDARADVRILVGRMAGYLEMGGELARSNPGLGLVRVKRLLRGERDPLVEAAGLRPEDAVLDATLGFGQESLVLAAGLGEAGRVVGVEASAPLAALAMAGVPYWPAPADRLVGRIGIEHADFRAKLESLPPGSFDVVYFDPMFRAPQSASPGFDVLRLLADSRPLDETDLALARRVARRRVVIKDACGGPELERLGVPVVAGGRHSDVVYGALPGGC